MRDFITLENLVKNNRSRSRLLSDPTRGPLSKMATTHYLPEMDRDRQQAEEETDCLFAENQIVRVRRMLCLGALASYGNDCH